MSNKRKAAHNATSQEANVNVFYNQDCVAGARAHLGDSSIDLIVSDPPYGIGGDGLDKHYNRDESKVHDGYVEVAADDYEAFSNNWIREAARVLKPGARILVVSGYTHLLGVLDALDAPANHLIYQHHIIWKYNFGVWTTKKYVSSHYHILCYEKRGAIERVRDVDVGDSVWVINREYQTGAVRNKNQLPSQLLKRLLNAGLPRERRLTLANRPLVADFFLGSFSTARTAIDEGMDATGFELNKEAYDYWNAETMRLLKPDAVKRSKTMIDYFKPATPSRELPATRTISTASRAASVAGPAEGAVVTVRTVATPVHPSANAASVTVVVCWSQQVPTAAWLDAVVASMGPGGSFYLVVASLQLSAALRLLHAQAELTEVNHLIWRSALGGVSSARTHLHILFWVKPGAIRTFNTYAFFKHTTRMPGPNGNSANYVDREDVWWKHAENRALTWPEVLEKILKYSSNARDKVASFCAGCDALQQVAASLNRVYCQ